MSICITVSVVSVILAILMWKKFYNYKVKKITMTKNYNESDYIVIGMIFIDFLQYINIGPEFKSFNILLDKLSNLISLNLTAIFDLDFVYFWIIFYATASLLVL